MSMAPALWLTNFALIYTLNPALAADMPAYWSPIPATVADAILASPTGQVPYSEFCLGGLPVHPQQRPPVPVTNGCPWW